jgi:predicted AAA+ superfamily ATPase
VQITIPELPVPRLAEARLRRLLEVTGAVVVEGPKWCGKTWLARTLSRSEVLLQDPTGNYRNRRMAVDDPIALLAGEKPRLLDEWQDAPGLWDAVRIQVDRQPGSGQFILTGSTTPREGLVAHSGTGRMSRLRLWTMSSTETGLSTGTISLNALFDGEQVPAVAGQATPGTLIRAIIRGGWPGALRRSDADAAELARQYLLGVIHSEASRSDGMARDPSKLAALLASLARNSATTVTNATLGRDMATTSGVTASAKTITEYLGVLGRLFTVVEIPAWSPALRSPVRLREQPKRMLVDPSLAVAALNADEESLAADPKTLGFLFESMCLRDLEVYGGTIGATVSHYRDNSGLEVDAILAKPSGDWAGVEIKWSGSAVDAAAATLLRLRDKMLAGGEKAPAFLMVLVGVGEFAHVRPDTVVVAPVDLLGI